MRRFTKIIFCLGTVLLAAGCPKGKTDYSQGRKAEHLQDYDEIGRASCRERV